MNVPDLADLPYAAHLTRHAGGLAANEDYDTVLFERLELTEPSAPNARFLECALRNVSITGGRLQRARLRDVWARDVRLTGTYLAESSWLDVTMLESVLAGTQIFGGRLERVIFSGCKLDAVNFRGSKLTGVSFERCVLREVDFTDATLAQCAFGGSQLARTNFTRARMDRTDLRGAELGIIVDAQSLRGAIVSSGQLVLLAPALAVGIGVVVSDD